MIGLALEGGGAKGSYQIGAYKALKELGYKFDYIVGTSIGAINGAMIVQGDEDLAEEIWREIKFSRVVNSDDEKLYTFLNEQLTLNNIVDKVSLIKDLILERGFDTTPLKKLLIDCIDEEKIRNSNTKLGLVTLDITNKKPIETFIEDIPNGKLLNYLYGSSNLIVFKQQPIDGRYLLDGGYYANNPLKMLDGRCDEIINVVLFPNRHRPKVSKNIDLKVISPREKLTDIMNFNKSDANYGINLGYYDTYKYFKKLLGEKYYIENPGNLKAIQVFSKAYDKYSSYSENPKNHRYFFERWMPLYLTKNNIPKNSDYYICLCDILDKMATRLEVERFKIYGIKSLSLEISQNANYEKAYYEMSFERQIINSILEV